MPTGCIRGERFGAILPGIFDVVLGVGGGKDGGRFRSKASPPRGFLGGRQVPELREAWHWQMPYAFAQEQLSGDLLGSTLLIGSWTVSTVDGSEILGYPIIYNVYTFQVVQDVFHQQ